MENDDRRGRGWGAPDERDRDYDRGPSRRSSNRSLWIVLGTVGCGLLLMCSGAIAVAVFWGVRSFTTDAPAAQAVADEFLDRLRENKLDDAYALTSRQFRAEQSREQFADFVRQFETLTRHTSRTRNGFRLFQDGRGKRVFIQTTLNAPNNAMTCTLVMIEEAGAWKVEKVTVP